MANNHHYTTERGHHLLFMGQPLDKPVLTLENYGKWYEMHVIQPDGTVAAVDVKVLSETMDIYSDALWIDHLFSPRLIYRVAQQMDYYVDERALEVALGRWVMEGHENISLACMEPNDGPDVEQV
jgi:hypothetical protein